MEINIAHGVAGAGKTGLLLGYLDEELKRGVPKNRIAYVSFTNEGAYVGRTRAMERFGGVADDYPYFRTLHSIAYRALGLGRLSVMTPYLYKHFGEMMGLKLWGHISPEGTTTTDDTLVAFDSLRRNNPRQAGRLAWDIDMDVYQWFDRNYKKFKKHEGVKDFTDFLEEVIAQQLPLPVDVAIIDEAQDLTTLQWKAIWSLFHDCQRVYVAGDADQAIYQWSGADVQYYLSLKPTHPSGMKVLSHTHRCPAEVVLYANKVLGLIDQKIPKTITSRPEPGVCELINELSELNINPDEDWLFLARNNVFLDDVETFLKARGLVYVRAGKESIRKKDMDIIRKYTAAQRGATGIGPDLAKYVRPGASVDAPWYEALDLDRDTIDYYRSILDEDSGLRVKNANIRLSTIHSAKGAEATNVVVITDMSCKTWKAYGKDADAELRCYYVAVTRAKYRLFLVAPHTKRHYPMLF